MLDAEEKRLLLEYLTPAERAEYDVPIDWKQVEEKAGDPKYGAPERIGRRRFAEAKGIDPDDHAAVGEAFRAEAWQRFQEKEQQWWVGEGEQVKNEERS